MERVLTALTVLLYVVLRFWRLTQFNLQRDEIFSLETARLGWRVLFTAVTADVVHPPLFYSLLKIWILLGSESLLWLRLLPTLIAIATLIPFFLLCRELKIGAAVCNIALFLWAVNAYFINYAHELRMYSLLLCFALVAVWTYMRLLNIEEVNRRELLALFVAHVLLVYTHYYGWLLIGAEFLFVLIWKRERIRVFTGLIVVLAISLLPWVLVILNALQTRTVSLGTQLSWHFRPGLVDFAAYYALLNGPFTFPRSTTVGLLVFFGIILAAAILLWRDQAKEAVTARVRFSLLVALAFVPPVLAFCLSRFSSYSIWHPRYLIIAGVPYLLLIAYSLMQLRPRWLRLLLVTLVMVWATLSGSQQAGRADTRIEWDVLARELSVNEPARDLPIKVYTFDDLPRYPMKFYLESAREKRFRIAKLSATDLNQISEDRFWILYSEATWPLQKTPQQLLESRDYLIGPTIVSGPGRRGYTLFAATRNN